MAMTGKIEGDKLTLLTRATPMVLAAIPGIEGRRTWLKGGGLRLEATTHNVEHLKSMIPDLEIEGYHPEIAEAFDVGSTFAQQFEFKREPDPHQLTALERCSTKQHFGLFMEQGTGKTKVAIDRACQLFIAEKLTGVLVVTKKGVHRQWVDAELPKDHSPEYLGSFWNKKPIPPELLVQGGSLKWYSINYDALRSKKAMEACFEFVRAHKGSLLIVSDESQCIKNHSSGRHKHLMMLKPFASHRLMLTGTPIAKDLTDEWAQLKWLNEQILGVKYLTTFRAKYCIMGGFEGRQVIGQKNMDEFKERVDPHTYRVTKEQIGYIPKHYKEWVYDLTKEQKRLIKQVKQELLAEVSDGEVVQIKTATSAFTKAQQITNGFILDEEGKVVRLMPLPKNPRIQAALEYLDSVDGKAVIWTRFIADRELLGEAMREVGIYFSEYTGSDAAREHAKQLFIEDPKIKGFLANPQSAGTGLDGLQTVCSQALYYSNSFNSIDRWQSEDRIDRRGMIGGSVYTDLIGIGSPDRHIIRSNKKKKGLSAMTLGDIQMAFDGL